jgi:hypothetical protein
MIANDRASGYIYVRMRKDNPKCINTILSSNSDKILQTVEGAIQ